MSQPTVVSIAGQDLMSQLFVFSFSLLQLCKWISIFFNRRDSGVWQTKSIEINGLLGWNLINYYNECGRELCFAVVGLTGHARVKVIFIESLASQPGESMSPLLFPIHKDSRTHSIKKLRI